MKIKTYIPKEIEISDKDIFAIADEIKFKNRMLIKEVEEKGYKLRIYISEIIDRAIMKNIIDLSEDYLLINAEKFYLESSDECLTRDQLVEKLKKNEIANDEIEMKKNNEQVEYEF